MHVTFICTGNTCRSPMAEGIARKMIEEQFPGLDVSVSSAGIGTENGLPASELAIEVCREIGVDISGHRTRMITPEIIRMTDLFIVPSPQHTMVLTRVYHVPERKIHMFSGGIRDPYDGDRADYRVCRDNLYYGVRRLLRGLKEDLERIKEDLE